MKNKNANPPHYSEQEEYCNTALHAAGCVLIVFGTAHLLTLSNTIGKTICALLYGACIFAMYLSSSVYHFLRNQKQKALARKVDHAMIYYAIAGTFFPVVISSASPNTKPLWFAAMGTSAFLGGVFSFITLRFKHLTTAIYLMMGWSALFLLRDLWRTYPHEATWLLLGGGGAYSIGALLYLIHIRFMHCIFHFFVLLGSLFQYLAILVIYR